MMKPQISLKRYQKISVQVKIGTTVARLKGNTKIKRNIKQEKSNSNQMDF